MKGLAQAVDWDILEPWLRQFASRTQTFITADRSYEIHALSVYMGIVFCLVIDDRGASAFVPASFFQIVNRSIPHDWVLGQMPDIGVDLVIGPEFVAKDATAYTGMVDCNSQQLAALWERIRGEAGDRRRELGTDNMKGGNPRFPDATR